MKKMIGYFCIGILAVSLCGSCDSESDSDIKKTMDENGFLMEYFGFDENESCDMELIQGDELRIEYSHELGSLDIYVGMDQNYPLYIGKEQTNGEFVLIVPEDGNYRISFFGHNAAGHISFNKK